MSRNRGRQSRSAPERLVARAAFAVPLLVFLVIGIAWVGDFSAQWWLLLLPVALLVQPAIAVFRDGGRPRDQDQDSPDRR